MPIVKLLDSYKVHSFIKVDPLWRSLVELGSPVFFMFFQCRNHDTLRRHSNRTPSRPLRLPHRVIYSFTPTLPCAVHPFIHLSLFSPLSLSLSPSVVGLLLHLFYLFFSRFFTYFTFFLFVCFECFSFFVCS